MAIRYAVVETAGMHGSGESVRAISVHRSLVVARRIAQAVTSEYRRGMAPYGGSSGGYRVVETDAGNRTQTSWLGHELDRTPSAPEARS